VFDSEFLENHWPNLFLCFFKQIFKSIFQLFLNKNFYFLKFNFRKFLCFFLGIFTVGEIFAQNPVVQDTTQGKLRVEFSEFGEMILQGSNGSTEKFSGNVRLRQDNTLLYADTVLKKGDDARAWGKVIIEQGDSVKIFADSTVYFGVIREADLFGDVVLKNAKQELFTSKLHYDLNLKIASFESGAKMWNGKTMVKSRRGKYFTDEKLAFFQKDVIVTDPEFTLRTDSIKFHTETNVATFLAPTLISQKDSKIYTEGGFFETDVNYAEFTRNPQFTKIDENGIEQRGKSTIMRYDGQTKNFFLEGAAEILEGEKIARADTILYGEEDELIILEGNAFYKDSAQVIEAQNIRYDEISKTYSLSGGVRVNDPPNILVGDRINFNDELGGGRAEGEVVWQDTSAKMAIRCHQMDYNKNTDFLLAVGGQGGRRRPLLSVPISGDTLWMACDTLHSFRRRPTDSLDTDTLRILTGHFDVRIFKNDLQAICDSLSFDTNDSIFIFYKNPFLWSDSTQFSADTIKMWMKNEQLERMKLLENSFILSKPEIDTILLNQIKGKYATAFFENKKINLLDIEQNTESSYWIKDDSDAYLGANKTTSPRMKINFLSGSVEGIRFYGASTGKFSPAKEVRNSPEQLDLPGRPAFLWNSPRRPNSVESLDGEEILEENR
jgi:lipopolysaccharide export system protein LptA